MSAPRPVEEAARFSSYSEAQVACSALRSAGIEAVVIDSDPIAGIWREPYGRGGFRVGAPGDQVVQARVLLRLFEAAPEPETGTPHTAHLADAPPPDRLGMTRLILVGALFLAIAVGFVLSRL